MTPTPPNGQAPEHVQPQPSPASWSITTLAEKGPGGQPLYALTLYLVTGPCITFWTGDAMIRFIGGVREHVTGLHVADKMP